jgi:hypothetical protein
MLAFSFTACAGLKITAAALTMIEHTKHKTNATVTVFWVDSLLDDTAQLPSLNVRLDHKVINQRRK